MSHDLSNPTTLTAALLLGLATSLHCVGMCGPIACGLSTLAKSEGERLGAASLYHGTRLFSYALIGAICGALGQQPLKWFFDSPAVLLPWMMVVALIVIAFGIDQKLPRPAALTRFIARTRIGSRKLSAYGSSSVMGLLTPLLPCSYLYLVFASALLTGSAVRGAEHTLAFGLGTVPLLWLTHHQFHRIRALLSPTAMNRLRRGLALITALVLAWRLHATIPPEFYGRQSEPVKEQELPSCCH